MTDGLRCRGCGGGGWLGEDEMLMRTLSAVRYRDDDSDARPTFYQHHLHSD